MAIFDDLEPGCTSEYVSNSAGFKRRLTVTETVALSQAASLKRIADAICPAPHSVAVNIFDLLDEIASSVKRS